MSPSRRKTVILSQHTPAQDVARAMRNNRIGCVLIGKGGNQASELVGIVTDRDFACRLAADHAATLVPVHEIMSRSPITAFEDTPLKEILHLMEAHGIRRIPILASNPPGSRKCVGIVTLDGLIALRLMHPNLISRIIQRQLGPITEKWEHKRTERSDTRRRQALAHFYRTVAQETDLPEEAMPRISEFLLESIFRRIPYSSAMNFASQLPLLLRQTVLRIQPGPDRQITGARIVEELVESYEFTEEFARSVLSGFFAALKQVVDPAAVAKLQYLLPDELIHPASPMRPGKEFESMSKSSGKRHPTLELTSPDFDEMQQIPIEYSGEGEDKSPPLQWSKVPDGTMEFALICEDPDSPSRKPWAHWVMYGISAATTRIPAGIPPRGTIDAPVRCRQGLNSSGTVGYSGPFPPKGHGWHRYVFKLYALEKPINLPPGATREELIEEMMGFVIAEGTLIGRYRREVGKEAA